VHPVKTSDVMPISCKMAFSSPTTRYGTTTRRRTGHAGGGRLLRRP
jgi:hypothetical protein